MMNISNIISKIAVMAAITAVALFPSCDYLDVVPEEIITIEHAFRNRTETQKFMYGCFSNMPDVGNMEQDPAMLGSDEIWVEQSITNYNVRMRGLVTGMQGTVSPLANYWMSRRNDQATLNGGKNLWTGIYDCNVFLENIDKPYDLMATERLKWTGQVLFLKAYLHYWLFRQYGPIPLMRENQVMDAPGEELMWYREPVDTCVNYIAGLLDRAAELLPVMPDDPNTELGLPTRCIALALKAELYVLAASPLFNCNEDLAYYKDKLDRQLFPQDKDQETARWQRAADALKAALDEIHATDFYRLYNFRIDYNNVTNLSDATVHSMQVRSAVTEPWNNEIIWGNSRLTRNSILQRANSIYFDDRHLVGGAGERNYGPTLTVVEQFYTKNGIPIEDDEEWVGKDHWALRTALSADKYYIREGQQTIELNFDREPRFYGALTFDRGRIFGNSRITKDAGADDLWTAEMRVGNRNGWDIAQRSTHTGYLAKKLVSFRSSVPNENTTWTNGNYSFPIIRLADLYLLYAEALNEVKPVPDDEVYFYIDTVRTRSGLEKVKDSWQQYAVAEKKNYPDSKEGMREIIRRERMNEFAFEGIRFWDMRRWKKAKDLMNLPIRGLSVQKSRIAEYYRETVIFQPVFDEKKDYFFPVREKAFEVNTNLLQSPGWQ
ncbi:MAG: RagB/SusD family nutrient uptake outer membrane protein [Bacteroidales bacterium]|jgi:hypothetical protein|nr:RagB/SusD family nutrient uptake outer membrane protein [Bacteroidales bacterium]